MANFQIGVLGCFECSVRRNGFNVGYTASKVYLGRTNTLPQPISISLSIMFETESEMSDFFDFWDEKTLGGAKPFYAKLPLYSKPDFYLIQLNGALKHVESPIREVSGTFTVYRDRTLDENIAPTVENVSMSVDMDSTNNYVYVPHVDVGDTVTYSLNTPPANGELIEIGGGSYAYSPTDNFSGTDTFIVTVTDELGATATATVTVSVINWKLSEEFTLELNVDGELVIGYTDESQLEPTLVLAIDELSQGEINLDGEFILDITQANHIDDIIQTIDGEWVITPTP